MSGAQSPERPRLRVGLLLDAFDLAAWEWRMVQKITTAACADLVLVIVAERPPETPPRSRPPAGMFRHALRALLSKAYDYWDARYPCEPDAFARRDAGELLTNVPVVRAALAVADLSARFSCADLQQRIRSAGLDVLLTLSEVTNVGELAPLAKYGVWGLHHGDEDHGFGTPPGFWEVFYGLPRSASGVHMVDPATGHKKLLARSYASTNPFSTWRNNNARYWKTASLIPRKLNQLWKVGEHAVLSHSEPDIDQSEISVRPPQREPGTQELASFLVGRFTQALRSRIQEVFTLPQWILLFHFGDDFLTRVGDFTQIVPPKDRFWADPHVIQREGKYYVFIEEFLFETSKGHISVLLLDESGVLQAPVKVLERHYHLSYPSLFESDGELYMIPESSDNRTVELYRCVDFPTRWEFVRNLLEGIEAVDATVLHHDGRWWLFANLVEEPGASSWDELFLFHSESLLAKEWTPHTLNPVISDARRARPAGAILRQGARLYRPSQDCSARYGYAIHINEITRLSVDEYEEAETVSIVPDGSKDIIGTHTYAHAGRLTVLDALRPRWRF
jgi:hypothetical protein